MYSCWDQKATEKEKVSDVQGITRRSTEKVEHSSVNAVCIAAEK